MYIHLFPSIDIQTDAAELMSTENQYPDIARWRIFEVAGDDNSGRKVVTLSACRLPPSDKIDHRRFLEFVFVEFCDIVHSLRLIPFHSQLFEAVT